MYKKNQKESKRKARLGRYYTKLGTYIIKRDGLIGSELEVLKTLISKDNKIILQDNISNLQKKVIRKMNWNKKAFLKTK